MVKKANGLKKGYDFKKSKLAYFIPKFNLWALEGVSTTGSKGENLDV